LTSYVGVLGTNYTLTDGVFFLDSAVRWADITDGTSQTLMAGERPPSTDFWYGWWYTGYGQLGSGSLDMLLGAAERNSGARYVGNCPPGPARYGPGTLTDQCAVFHFWSLHPGGGNFVFCDGSVHFLTYDAAAILPALATRSGQEVVSLP
jgi:prepilin-type processing-associated H-X9-DG protein